MSSQDSLNILKHLNFRNRKVLVIGASGFVGAYVCAVLRALGAEVYGTTRKLVHPYSSFNLLRIEDRIGLMNGDITDLQNVIDMINTVRPHIIIHLAAKALVPVALADPLRAINVNVIGTMNILEACRRLQHKDADGMSRSLVERVLIVSTDHVFGNNLEKESFLEGGSKQHGFSPEAFVNFGGPYDTSKAAMELLTRCYHYTFADEMPMIGITRAANIWGYGDINLRRILPLFTRWATAHPYEIYLKYRWNGRQFLHVTDAVAGYLRAVALLDLYSPQTPETKQACLDREHLYTPTFHFALTDYGTGRPFIYMRELADLVAKTFSSVNAKVVEVQECRDYAPDENRVQALNCDSTQRMLGWTPRKSLEEGIWELGEWYRETNESRLQHMIERSVEEILKLLEDNESLSDPK